MRLEKRLDDRGELKLRHDRAEILSSLQLARLCVWIEELWPEEVARERSIPAVVPLYRDDEEF